MSVLPSQLHTCRLCGDWHEAGPEGPIIKYSVRHYAHADCALKKWGAGFFDRLRDWQIANFPALIASRYGLYDELGRRIKAGDHETEIATREQAR